MDFSKQLIKDMLGAYLETTFSKVLPSLISEALQGNDLFVAQDFVSIDEATRRYNLCRKTLYNYHNKGYITLHSSEGKTFVSIRELEAHIRKNPLPRNLGMKIAA
jgi:ACT domain-containing protein